MSEQQFWADDFDADLLKVVPEARDRIGELAHLKLWTYCQHPKHGRINSPASWHSDFGLTAFFWTKKPEHPREHGFATFGRGYTTSAPLLECNWLEVLRDCWVHGFNINLDGRAANIGQKFSGLMMRLMYDLRGWRTYSGEDLAATRADVLALIVQANELLGASFDDHLQDLSNERRTQN